MLNASSTHPPIPGDESNYPHGGGVGEVARRGPGRGGRGPRRRRRALAAGEVHPARQAHAVRREALPRRPRAQRHVPRAY